jgi:LPXTG-motif cell wall-anchored protein
VEKLLEVDETFGVGNRGEIQNVAFALYAAEELTAGDGSVIPKDGLLEVQFCDENGKITFNTDLPLGSYYVKEFATDCHYLISDTTYPVTFTYAGQETALVTITANDGEAITNTLLRGRVEGLKLTTSEEPLEGALFGLFRINAESYTEEYALLTAASDAEGRFAFENIPYGNYVVRELAAPESYAVNEDNYYVSITADGQTIGIQVVDEKITGSLEITKTDVATGALIPNCGFEVLDADGNVLVQGYTDENGKAVFPDLEYGDYFYREFDAPEGYLIDEEAYPFSIRENHEVVKAAMTNQKIMGSLELTKKDVSDGELIPNCGVEILDKDGNVIVQGKTDENGVIVFDSLEYGDYFYREYNAPEGYVIDETAYPFSITEDGQVVKAEMTNRKIQGTLELTKKDVSTGELLPNAKFRIYDEDGNVVAEGVTDENGLAVFELTYGKYTYQEYEAPEGYVIDETRFPFEIKEDGEVVKAEMTNTAVEDAPTPEDQGQGEDITTVTSTPKTGDTAPLGLYLGLLGLSAAGIGGAVYVSRKKKRN